MSFKSTELANSFEKTLDRCKVVTRAEAEFFITNGFVVIRHAFPREHAERVSELSWQELAREHGVNRNDPNTWARRTGEFGPAGYTRLKVSDKLHKLKQLAPRAFHAQNDLVGGPERFPNDAEDIAWYEASISNLGVEGDPDWEPPTARQEGWHKDGWHFRHFLNSPEQALVVVPLYSDIEAQSGGTHLAVDSVAPVAKLLSQVPNGLHPDSVQGSGYVNPGLLDQCKQFTEMTGDAGDLILLHPYMMHRVCVNPSNRARFIANMAPVLAEPMKFNREPDDCYSLVELATLHALGESNFTFEQTRSQKAITPGPFRDEADRDTQTEHLRKEMRDLAQRGIVTPRWAPDHGYMTNREFIN